MNTDDQVILHTAHAPITEQQLDVMFAKARAAVLLGLHFTIESAPRLTISVHTDQKKLVEAHYTEQARRSEDLHQRVRASDEQNRSGLAKARVALSAVGDPDPDLTIAFVGADTAFADAQARHMAEGLGALGLIDNGMPAAYDRAETRIGRRS